MLTAETKFEPQFCIFQQHVDHVLSQEPNANKYYWSRRQIRKLHGNLFELFSSNLCQNLWCTQSKLQATETWKLECNARNPERNENYKFDCIGTVQPRMSVYICLSRRRKKQADWGSEAFKREHGSWSWASFQPPVLVLHKLPSRQGQGRDAWLSWPKCLQGLCVKVNLEFWVQDQTWHANQISWIRGKGWQQNWGERDKRHLGKMNLAPTWNPTVSPCKGGCASDFIFFYRRTAKTPAFSIDGFIFILSMNFPKPPIWRSVLENSLGCDNRLHWQKIPHPRVPGLRGSTDVRQFSKSSSINLYVSSSMAGDPQASLRDFTSSCSNQTALNP